MPLRVLRDDDADLDALRGRTVAVIGYGKQGRTQALNLRDSGVPVVVASARSVACAEADGFRAIPFQGCAREADVLLLLVPDEVQPRVYHENLAADLKPGHVLCFASGYSFHFGAIRPPAGVDVVMVAPRMLGAAMRESFERGAGVPAYVAVGQDSSGQARTLMLALAKAIGCTRAGVIETTFETEAALDLFMEQAVLPVFVKTILSAFEVLAEAGFDPAIVALEMYGSGEMAEVFEGCAAVGFFEQMFRFHSRTAQYGELSRQDTMLPESVRSAMREALRHILSGDFAREWATEEKSGFPTLNALVEAARSHPINEAERALAAQLTSAFAKSARRD